MSFTEDVGKRFEAYGWNVEHVTDANDLQMLADAYNGFLQVKDRPTLIRVNSHIGYGSPHKQDTSAAHGEPLGEEEVRLVKKFYGWPEDAKFLVPDGVLDNFKNGIGKRGGELPPEVGDAVRGLRKEVSRPGQPDQAHATARAARRMGQEPANVSRGRKRHCHAREFRESLERRRRRMFPGWWAARPTWRAPTGRGSKFDGAGDFQAGSYGGRNLHFGVREHGMAAALNGMAVSKIRPFGGTFFNFSDYMRPSIRLAALMEIPTIYVWTHDSIGLGEDGPTHQPIEQLASLRAMPGLMLMRPARCQRSRRSMEGHHATAA